MSRVPAALVIGSAPLLPAQTADADLAAGIQRVDEGDYATAVITLDRAARALSGHKERTHDLAQAYLYLGIAYVGLGSETSAKARFRDALAQAGDLNLSPEKFPPKVIELFEKAREENRHLPAASPSAEPAAKRGSKLPLILIGVGAAAAGGVALAAGGGQASSPTAAAGPDLLSETFVGSTNLPYAGGYYCGPRHTLFMSQAGLITASVTPSSLRVVIWRGNCNVVACTEQVADSPGAVSQSVAPGDYASWACDLIPSNTPYTLRVTHPR